jgi:hypothetical protein
MPDLSGRPYATTSDTRAGSILEADGDFDCITKGAHLVVRENPDAEGDLIVDCTEGEHHLSGQTNEDGEYVGFYHARQTWEAGLEALFDTRTIDVLVKNYGRGFPLDADRNAISWSDWLIGQIKSAASAMSARSDETPQEAQSEGRQRDPKGDEPEPSND